MSNQPAHFFFLRKMVALLLWQVLATRDSISLCYKILHTIKSLIAFFSLEKLNYYGLLWKFPLLVCSTLLDVEESLKCLVCCVKLNSYFFRCLHMGNVIVCITNLSASTRWARTQFFHVLLFFRCLLFLRFHSHLLCLICCPLYSMWHEIMLNCSWHGSFVG